MKENKKSDVKLRVPFRVVGQVIKGKLQGTRLGFPTANIILPISGKSGIYIGKVRHQENTYSAAIYIGSDEKILEAHLLDFSGQIYNQKIEVVVQKKIRDVQDFLNYDELIQKIQQDVEAVKKHYSSAKNKK